MDRHGNHRLRQGRFSESGRLYLLTTVTRQRRPLFQNLWFARAAINQLRLSDHEGSCRTLAWALMPDHLHFVAQLMRGRLSGLMQRVKGGSARRIHMAVGRDGRLWQPGYHDRALRDDEEIKDAIGYCLMNPQRAELVADFHDYPHLWCRWELS